MTFRASVSCRQPELARCFGRAIMVDINTVVRRVRRVVLGCQPLVSLKVRRTDGVWSVAI